MRSSIRFFAVAAFFVVATLPLLPAHGADDPKRPPSVEDVQGAIPLLTSPDKAKRLAATQSLFQQDRKVLADLKKAGAKHSAHEATGISTRRLDMVYTLITGLALKPNDFYDGRSFGIHVEKGTTRETVVEWGKKYGFTVGNFGEGSPNCYVQLNQGIDLAGAMRTLLTHEADVVTLNLNYVERGQSR